MWGSIEIESNTLTNLEGMESLQWISGSLHIFNSSLSSLTGLNNLRSVGLWLIIAQNNSLTSLTGLDNLRCVKSLHINSNVELCTYLAEEIRDQITTDSTFIEGNKDCSTL